MKTFLWFDFQTIVISEQKIKEYGEALFKIKKSN